MKEIIVYLKTLYDYRTKSGSWSAVIVRGNHYRSMSGYEPSGTGTSLLSLKAATMALESLTKPFKVNLMCDESSLVCGVEEDMRFAYQLADILDTTKPVKGARNLNKVKSFKTQWERLLNKNEHQLKGAYLIGSQAKNELYIMAENMAKEAFDLKKGVTKDAIKFDKNIIDDGQVPF